MGRQTLGPAEDLVGHVHGLPDIGAEAREDGALQEEVSVPEEEPVVIGELGDLLGPTGREELAERGPGQVGAEAADGRGILGRPVLASKSSRAPCTSSKAS
jgi:hypothetical protein